MITFPTIYLKLRYAERFFQLNYFGVTFQDLENRYGVHSNTISPLSESETWKEAHPNDVAALLKQFLRELPDPLLTTQFIDAFQSCGCK